MGLLSAILAVVALVAGIIGAAVGGNSYGRFMLKLSQERPTTQEASDAILDQFSVNVGIGVTLGIFATVCGITALILGIIAAVQRRGRGWGVAAICVAAAAPFVCAVALGLAATAGTGGDSDVLDGPEVYSSTTLVG